MDKILGYLAMAYIFLPWRPIVVLVAAILFVNINGTELYGWQAGLAHGLCFLPNLVRHLFDGDVLFKATNCTTGYHKVPSNSKADSTQPAAFKAPDAKVETIASRAAGDELAVNGYREG